MAGVTQVRLHTVYARVSVRQTPTRLEIEHSRENFSSLRLSRVELQSEGPTLRLDGTPTREALGFRNVKASRRAWAEQSREATRAGIDRIVSQGNALGDIAGGVTVAQVHRTDYMAGLRRHLDLASVPPPDTGITPRTVDVGVTRVGGPSPLFRAVPRMQWTPPEFEVGLEPPGALQIDTASPGFAVGQEIDAFA